MFSTAVGILDKKTGKIQVFDSSMFHVNHFVKNLENPDLLVKGSADSYMAARDQLDEAFGTKKKKRELKNRDKNKIDILDLSNTADVISKEIEEKSALLPSESEIQEEINANRLIPPFELSASVPGDIYPLNGIISPHELDLMPWKELASLVNEANIEEISGKYGFGQYLRKLLRCHIKSPLSERTLKLLWYVHFLLKAKGLRENVLNNNEKFFAEMGPISVPVKNRILSTFFEEQHTKVGQRKKTKATGYGRDKITAYVCVLSLIIEGFSVEVAEIASDLGVGSLKINDFYKSVGCYIDKVKGENAKVAVLKAPLTFPKPKLGARKK